MRHEPRVRNAHAEAEGAHGERVGDGVLNGLDDERDARLVTGVDLLEREDVVAATRPLHVRQIGAVVQPEVLEGAQQASLEGIPQPEFDGNAAIEPLEHALTVGALRSCRQAQKDLRAQMLQEAPVRRRRRMVEFVDDHDIERVGCMSSRSTCDERLNRGEHVPSLLRAMAIDEQLAE